MTETSNQRRRRKFVAGVLDQLGGGLAAYSAGVLVAGVVAPLVAARLGATSASAMQVLQLAGAAAASATSLLLAAVLVKGASKRLEDDGAKPVDKPMTSDHLDDAGGRADE